MGAIPERQVPSVYRRKIGNIVVTALSDGYLDADVGVLRRISREEIDKSLAECFRPVPPRLSVNAFLIHSISFFRSPEIRIASKRQGRSSFCPAR